MLLRTTFVLASALLVALTSDLCVGQSVDPLNGSTFVPSTFSVANTFTPVTTYASATGGVQTVIGGPGPSVTPDGYSFTYTKPTATVPMTPLSNLYNSLASAGYPTNSDAKNLVPNPSNLQFADAAVRGVHLNPLLASALALAAGFAMVILA